MKYASVYPGVDLLFYGNDQFLEYDFVVQPGAEPHQIGLDLDGARVNVNKVGDLIVTVDGGEEIRFNKPVIYQVYGNARRSIDGRFRLDGVHASFEIGHYDGRKPLVIDPVLVYSTYLGGSNQDIGGGIAVEIGGSAYVTGFGESADFPWTSGAFQTSLRGPSDIFVTKFSPSGNSLIYSTYLGGSGAEFAANSGTDSEQGIAVDSLGNAYVVGETTSNDFPTTPTAYQNSCVAWLLQARLPPPCQSDHA